VPASLTPESVAGVGTVAEARWSPDGRRLAWVRGAAGTAVLVVDGRPVPDLVAAGTRGGTFAWMAPDRIVAVGDGGLRAVWTDEPGPAPVVAASAGRAAAPAVSATGLVAYVDETDDACVVKAAPLDGSRAPWVVSRADFAWDPAWSPDGTLLAWHEWDVPTMPWDGSRIVVADPDGADRVVVAGGATESVGQPRFAPVGPARLAFVHDRDGWANVTVARPDGRARAVVAAEHHEHAEPSWGPGQRSFAWSPDAARLAWCRNEDGFGRLVASPVAGWPVGEWSKGWHHGLDWGPAGLVCVRSGARTPPTVVVLSGDPSDRRVVDGAAEADALPTGDFVEPRPVTWAADDTTAVPGLLFSPPDRSAPPPLLVNLHGGPTDQARVEWQPKVQYWVARGWAVLAPNPRGSTGYGRAYTQALAGGWGALDVDDVLAGIRAAVERGWGDPQRIALVGGSAGAFTALLVAARAPDLVRAVAASYPVTDLVALAAKTHRFERWYSDSLVGVLPDAADRSRDRSPVTHAAALRVPLLVLQGDADPVVPHPPVVAFADAVRAAGGDVELHLYPGEGHGFERPDTIADALRRTDDFLTRKVLERER
jgi:dipeptidyl aminopeptidase/acylaminoacyl peptidase